MVHQEGVLRVQSRLALAVEHRLPCDVVEGVVLAEDERQQDDSYWPDVGLVALPVVSEQRLDGHVGLSSDLVLPHTRQTVVEFVVQHQVQVILPLLGLPLQSPLLGLEPLLVSGVHFSQSEVDDHAFASVWVVQEVGWLDVSVEDAHIFEALQTDQQFHEIVLHVFQLQGVKKILGKRRNT